MEQDLLDALRAKYGENLSPTSKHYWDFAVSNRARAKTICDQIKARTDFVFRGSRVLDVGCAYAGFVILAAKLGADAWGVEIHPQFYEYGVLNARGEPGDIHLIHGDFLSPKVGRQLPTGFNLVLLNDVFEHIYDTSRLLGQLHQVMAERARIIFTVPNGEALEFIKREGHHLRLGLTLLTPEKWHKVVGESSVYYRPWSYYLALLRAFGFGHVCTWNAAPQMSLEGMIQALRGQLRQIEAEIRASSYPDDLKTAMLTALDDLRLRADIDIDRQDADLLHRKYFIKFWQGCAVKTGPTAEGITPHN